MIYLSTIWILFESKTKRESDLRSVLDYLRAAVRKYRLGVCKIENPQTLSEYRSR